MVIDMPKVWAKQLMSRIQSIKNAQAHIAWMHRYSHELQLSEGSYDIIFESSAAFSLTAPRQVLGLLLGPRKQLLIEFVRSKTIYRSAKIHLELNVQDQGKTCKNFGKERRQWQSETPNIAK
ncbi:hypothetical protein C4D60_Mb01t01300 [Musa balbisiana]|uniref:Uncharacterized protein n=1 Tax=Musa balbisiana TaxID=52838 RepID=A0A4S8JJ94_MUSBA|nr:hypothetical protein C4D60_Mb01t01300 [Musa balbisiana]